LANHDQLRRQMRGGFVAKLKAPVRVEGITGAILVQRGHRVLLDEALAELYGVETKALVQAVKRNLPRFPPDFMFQLTPSEWAGLRSQFGDGIKGRERAEAPGRPRITAPRTIVRRRHLSLLRRAEACRLQGYLKWAASVLCRLHDV
jgi:hypothetical protein